MKVGEEKEEKEDEEEVIRKKATKLEKELYRGLYTALRLRSFLLFLRSLKI